MLDFYGLSNDLRTKHALKKLNLVLLCDAAVELKSSPVPSPLPLPGSRRSHVCSAASERMRNGERERERANVRGREREG